jgi:hypothetical protein
MAHPRFQQNALIILTAFFTFIAILKVTSRYGTASAITPHYPSIAGGPLHSKNAFAVFLNPNSNSKSSRRRKIDIHNEDHYFTDTRMLIYQFLHAPDTRTNTSIPFIVLVSEDVPQESRAQLTSEGAIVKEVEHLKYD